MKKNAFLILLCLFGCNVGPVYRVPKTEVPSQWKNPATTPVAAVPPIENWWQVFEDPVLDALQEKALAGNKELQIACERIRYARAIAGISRGDLFPQINLDPQYGNTGTLIKLYGVPAPPAGTPSVPSTIRVHEMNYALPFDFDYHLDFWGKLKNKYLSDLLNTEAKVEAWRATLLSLTSDLAIFYFQLRSLDSQLGVLDRTVYTLRDALKVNEERFHLGYINFSDVTRAEALLYSVEAKYLGVKRQRALQENTIALLLGVPASEFSLQTLPLEKKPPAIPSGIPSRLLLNRPDIREAERMVASEQALVKVAYAEFFPDFNLTGALGFLSPELADFLSWKSRLWSFGVNAIQPIFNGGKITSNVKAAKAVFREASLIYQQRVIAAFKEVEDALSDINYRSLEMGWLEKTVVASTETKNLSSLRYYKGLTNYLDVTSSERAQLDSELSLADQMGAQYVSTVRLIKALGGSWNNSTNCGE